MLGEPNYQKVISKEFTQGIERNHLTLPTRNERLNLKIIYFSRSRSDMTKSSESSSRECDISLFEI
ncbi:IS1 family transposase [Kistimonas asteriae]|uniref:IS1 family transposase n=1 Tax=Kistimonas asteriae TaxID=517724 RepID=UPI001BAB105D